MDKAQKRKLIIIGAIEAAIVVFALVVSILVVTTFHKPDEYDAYNKNMQNGAMIGFFQNNPTAFFLIIVLPLFLILALDVIYLIVYATRRESSLTEKERAAIEEQARKEAREEVLREMQEEASKPEEPKE